MSHSIEVLRILKTVFGYDQFRGDQHVVIERALAGQHSLVLMPTGMGKSLCFQIPSLLQSGLTIVISPLIALMEDQVQAARAHGIAATTLHSGLDGSVRAQRLHGVSQKQFQLLYVTPERFRQLPFREAVAQNSVRLLAVDEAHCISQWGHDFRPDYTRVGEFRQFLGSPATMALTATATPEVQKDIVAQLGLTPEQMPVFHHGLERPNLFLGVSPVYQLDAKVRAIIGLRHRHPGAAIIYCALISTLDKLSQQLSQLGISHCTYHSKMPDALRRKSQEQFLASADGLMLATPAFGLGVNKANVRLLIHAEMPGSIESYYQEVGRAGRDGQPSHCALLHDEDDLSIQMDFIKWANPDPAFVATIYRLLKTQPDKFAAEGADFLRAQMNFYNSRDFRVETALNLLERWDCIEPQGARMICLREPEAEELREDFYQNRLRAQNTKLLELVQMLKGHRCRRQWIYEYFGVEAGDPCGHCDVCDPKDWSG